MALSNPDRLVQVKHLSTFLSGLRNLFLTSTDADNNYASINGSFDEDFNADILSANSIVLKHETLNDVGINVDEIINGSVHTPAVRLKDSANNYIRVPLDSSTLATTAQLWSKSNAASFTYQANNTTVSKRFTVDPTPSVFSQVISGQNFNSQNQYVIGNIGTVVYYEPATLIENQTLAGIFTNGRGFYLITETDYQLINNAGTNLITEAEFICQASPYSLYYCIGTNSFYRLDTSVQSFVQIIPDGASNPDSSDIDDDYEPAQDNDIAELFDLITG